MNDIFIATLIAYYWDIERFKDVDSFIGYMVMGANPEVSGTSLNRMKTDKARAEVKGKFFMLFLQSHKESSPYKPLIDLLRSRLGGGNNQKKRYIKFLTDFIGGVRSKDNKLKLDMPYNKMPWNTLSLKTK